MTVGAGIARGRMVVDKWTIAAPFFGRRGDDRWLDDFVDDPSIAFRKQGPVGRVGDWHARRGRGTPVGEWIGFLGQARAAMSDDPDGIVTCFPQLAMCVALLKRLGRRKPRLIAYNYNLGGLPDGIRRRLARFVAREVDVYVVHAPCEVARYAAYLDVPPDRVRFVPLQRGRIAIARVEETDAPFLLAMGSAHRDYGTLIEAVEPLAIPVVIVTKTSEAAALPRSPHVTVHSNLSERECLELMSRARLSVTPVANLVTASGQVTFLNAMMLGVPVVATECPGTEGYVENGRTGLLVPPFDASAMRTAIAVLWDDPDRRAALAGAAQREAATRFSDEAAAAALVASMHGRPSEPA